jgi:hypothetical protein
MSQTVHFDPNNLKYDSGAAIAGVTGISVNSNTQPQVSRSDDGDFFKFSPAGHVSGSISFNEGFDPHSFLHGATAALGVKSIQFSDSATPVVSRSDAGTFVIFVPTGHVAGSVIFADKIEAAKVANKSGASITFVITDRGNASRTITITNATTGDVQTSFQGAAEGQASVSFVGDAVTNPQGADIAHKTTDAKNVTFDVIDGSGATKTVTLTGFKSGGISFSASTGGAGSSTVQFAAQSMTGPA